MSRRTKRKRGAYSLSTPCALAAGEVHAQFDSLIARSFVTTLRFCSYKCDTRIAKEKQFEPSSPGNGRGTPAIREPSPETLPLALGFGGRTMVAIHPFLECA